MVLADAAKLAYPVAHDRLDDDPRTHLHVGERLAALHNIAGELIADYVTGQLG